MAADGRPAGARMAPVHGPGPFGQGPPVGRHLQPDRLKVPERRVDRSAGSPASVRAEGPRRPPVTRRPGRVRTPGPSGRPGTRRQDRSPQVPGEVRQPGFPVRGSIVASHGTARSDGMMDRAGP